MTSYIKHSALGNLRVEFDNDGSILDVFQPDGQPLTASLIEEFRDSIQETFDEPEVDLIFHESRQELDLSSRYAFPV